MGRRGKNNKESEEVVPDEFRCKRSDGKQWRCGARAVEGKSMCEKHIGQAKKRAAGAATKTPATKRMKTSPGEEQDKQKLHKKRKTSDTPKKLKKRDSNEIESDSSDDMETDDEDSGSESPPPSKSMPKRGKSSPDSRGSDPPSSSKSMDNDSVKPYNEQEGDSDEKETELFHRKVIEKKGSPRKEKKNTHERKLSKDGHSSGKKSKENPNAHERKLKEKADDHERKVRFKEDSKDNSSQKKMKDKKTLKQNLHDSDGKVKSRPAEHVPQKPERKKNKVKTEESEDVIKQRLQDSSATTSGKIDADTKASHSKREVSLSAETLLVMKKKKKQRKTCHQCQKSDKEELVYCKKCNIKRYCIHCIRRCYPDVRIEDFEKSCPVCCGNCNCKSCQHMDNTKPLTMEEGKTWASEEQRITALQYMLSFLLPHLKDLDKQQKQEVELEAKIKGVSYVEVRRTALAPNEQISCDNCNATIIDMYRTCTDCGYDLCLTCCQELRDGKLHGQQASSEKNHSEDKLQISIDQENCHDLPVWKANDSGGIPCPPRQRGGCGSSHMALRRIAKQNYISKLVKRVEDVIPEENIRHSKSSVSCQLCSKDHEGVPSFCAKSIQKAANRAETFDNFIYCPSVKSIDSDHLLHFQKHWLQGEPVIVRDVLDNVGDLSWDPLKILLSFQEAEESKSVKAIDCLNWNEVEINIHEFLTGYRDGRKHKDGSPEMLKLRDWPPANMFYEKLPNYVASFISMLPFHDYTHPTRGMLNLATKCPDSILNPDLGPKTYIAYGAEELGCGASVSQLHCHMFDVVNILTHAAELTGELENKIKLGTEKHKQQNPVEGLQNDQNLDLSVQSTGVPHEEAIMDSPTNQAPLMEKDDGTTLGVADGRDAPQDICVKGGMAANGQVLDVALMEDAPVSSSNDVVISPEKERLNCESDKEEKKCLGIVSTIVGDGHILTDNPDLHDAGSSSQSDVLDHSEDKVPQPYCVNAAENSELTVADAPQTNILMKSESSACEINIDSSSQENVVDASQYNSLNNGEGTEAVKGMETLPETTSEQINSHDVCSSEKPVDNNVAEVKSEPSSQNFHSSETAIDKNDEPKSSQDGCLSEKSLDNTESQGTQANNIDESREILLEEMNVKVEKANLGDHSEVVKNNQERNPGTSLGDHVHTGVCQGILSEERKSVEVVHEQTNGMVAGQVTHHKKDLQSAPGGAVWDVFRQRDVAKLEAYLKRHWKEFQNTKEQLENVHSPIHEQSVFLNEEDKKKLKEEYGIEPWTFEQHVGEAVLIPAGCPHQVKNKKSCMKVALEFVTPESVKQCIGLANEHRKLPKHHRTQKNKLEVTKLVIFAASSAVKQLNHLTQSIQKAPEVSGEIGH